ncbi:MAG: hypothetical protein AAGA60_02535 [Cyanobacteria bacterium P01_E01_bin.42]
MLILGQPRSGKTTTLLDLAGELLARAQNPDDSIPVLLGLSSCLTEDNIALVVSALQEIL